MPLVFVHGVGVRDNDKYEQLEKKRTSLFRGITLCGIESKPQHSVILNPYWGKYGSSFSHDHASLPNRDDIESFGSDIESEFITEAEIIHSLSSEQIVLQIARDSFGEAVDWFLGMALLGISEHNYKKGILQEFAQVASNAIEYTEGNPSPAWVGSVGNDSEFLDQFRFELQNWKSYRQSQVNIGESFGTDSSDVWSVLNETLEYFRDRLSHALKTTTSISQNVIDYASRSIASPFFRAGRPLLHYKVTRFIGDVFTYINRRGEKGSEGPIVEIVGGAFKEAACAKNSKDDKFIIVAHSMGGNVSYDILSYFMPDIVCDLFVTVGSQVGLFEELKLFKRNIEWDGICQQSLIQKPDNIKHWLNIYDPIDILGYSVEGVFDQAKDLTYSTKTHPFSAHSTYFYRPSFHQKLNKRIKEIYGTDLSK